MNEDLILKSDLIQFLSANKLHTYDYTDGFATTTAQILSIEGHSGCLLVYQSLEELTKDVLENTKTWDPTEGADDQYYDYNPSCLEAIIYALPKLNPMDQETVIEELIPKLRDFINDLSQDADMEDRYSYFYEALLEYKDNKNPQIFEGLCDFDEIIYSTSINA